MKITRILHNKRVIFFILSIIIGLIVIYNNPPNQRIYINFLSKEKVSITNNDVIFKQLNLYRVLSTFVKYYYVPNRGIDPYSLRQDENKSGSIVVNIGQELEFINEIYTKINENFEIMTASHMNYILGEIVENKNLSGKHKFFFYNSEVKLIKKMDPTNGKLDLSYLQIFYSGKIPFNDEEITEIKSIISQAISEKMSFYYKRSIDEIFSIIKDQIYDTLKLKSQEALLSIKNFQNNTNDNDILISPEFYMAEIIKYKALMRELNVDYKIIENKYNLFKEDSSVKFDIMDERLNSLESNNVIERSKISESYFFVLVVLFIILLNLSYNYFLQMNLYNSIKRYKFLNFKE
tara:strand:- start:1224 stop:2270 length:1047 start_codon:yes stop_codon:yes gene_type:complete